MTRPHAGSLRLGHSVRALRHGSGARRALCFAALMIVVGLLIVPVGGLLGGEPMARAALVAVGCCLVPGVASILVGHAFERAAGPLAALGVSMLLRTALPLGLGVALHLSFASLADAQFLLYMAAAYLPALAFETLIMLPSAPDPRAAAQQPGADTRSLRQPRTP